MSLTQTRVPSGVPTGGQFVATARAESEATLAEVAPAPERDAFIRRVDGVLSDLPFNNRWVDALRDALDQVNDDYRTGATDDEGYANQLHVVERTYFVDAERASVAATGTDLRAGIGTQGAFGQARRALQSIGREAKMSARLR